MSTGWCSHRPRPSTETATNAPKHEEITPALPQAHDFAYVQNVVAANVLALKGGRLDGSALNVACGERTSLLDVIGAAPPPSTLPNASGPDLPNSTAACSTDEP